MLKKNPTTVANRVSIYSGSGQTVKSLQVTFDSRYSRKVFFESPIDDTNAKSEVVKMMIFTKSTYDMLLGKQFENELEQFVRQRGFSTTNDSSTQKTFSWRLGQPTGLLAISVAFQHYVNFIKQFLENNEK